MIRILIFINLIVVLIWDVFRAPQSIADRVAEITTRGKIHTMQLKKPWGCSLCITFWLSLAVTYYFCISSIEGYLAATLISLLNAYLTKYTYEFIIIGETAVDKIIYYINTLIK